MVARDAVIHASPVATLNLIAKAIIAQHLSKHPFLAPCRTIFQTSQLTGQPLFCALVDSSRARLPKIVEELLVKGHFLFPVRGFCHMLCDAMRCRNRGRGARGNERSHASATTLRFPTNRAARGISCRKQWA